jgi:hypothetical protein
VIGCGTWLWTTLPCPPFERVVYAAEFKLDDLAQIELHVRSQDYWEPASELSNLTGACSAEYVFPPSMTEYSSVDTCYLA